MSQWLLVDLTLLSIEINLAIEINLDDVFRNQKMLEKHLCLAKNKAHYVSILLNIISVMSLLMNLIWYTSYFLLFSFISSEICI